MRFHAQTVASAVTNQMLAAGVDEDLPRRDIHRFAGDAWTRRSPPRLVRRLHHRIKFALLVARFADKNRARDVCAIAPVGGAEIDNQRVAMLNAILQRARMRQGRIDAGMKYGAKRKPVAAQRLDMPFQNRRRLNLAHADLRFSKHRSQRPLGDVDCSPQQSDFVGVLMQAQFSQRFSRVDHGRIRRGLTDNLAFEEAHAQAFNSDRLLARSDAFQRPAERALVTFGIGVGDELRRRGVALKKRDFQLGDDGDRRPIRDVEDDDRALQYIMLGARQIAMIGSRYQRDRIQPGFPHNRVQLVNAPVEIHNYISPSLYTN